MNKQERIDAFNDTMECCENIPLGNVEVIKENDEFKVEGGTCDKVFVTLETTFECALNNRTKDTKNITCLCFASAKKPGGGVVTGSGAQEECLCRESNLYKYLIDNDVKSEYYDYNINSGLKLYSDRMIWSGGVTVVKDKDLNYLNKRFNVNVINVPAPNLSIKENTLLSDSELMSIYLRRYGKMIALANAKGTDMLVLGAIGCGVFKNNPELVAKAFKELLEIGVGHINTVVFAIPDKKMYQTFRKVLL